jgi:AcrR family transcriptional regulator
MVSSTLLQTAISHFGHYGFDGASTRSIAAAAGTTMSSITYHFGGKEGLYLAAARHITHEIATLQGPATAATAARAVTSPEQAVEAAIDLLVSFAEALLRPEASEWGRFIAREQHDPTPAFEILYCGVMEPFANAFISLIARINPTLDAPDRRMRAILLFGQVLVLQTSRTSIHRILEMDRTDDFPSEVLIRHLRRNARLILTDR